jgi:hypothetical protein
MYRWISEPSSGLNKTRTPVLRSPKKIPFPEIEVSSAYSFPFWSPPFFVPGFAFDDLTMGSSSLE